MLFSRLPVCIVLAFLATTGSASANTTPGPAPSPNTTNIVQLAQSVPDLSTLVTALVAGNLTTALSGTGPFTVFAPTNEAFLKIPAATLEHLLDPANIKELDALLEYHVIAGAAIYSKDLKPDQKAKTLEGESLDITASSKSGVQINGVAKVTAADNAATNGVVHIIDAVLILAPTKSCVGRCDIKYNANLPCQCNQAYCNQWEDNCCDDWTTACNKN